jgi:hypothetical protein
MLRSLKEVSYGMTGSIPVQGLNECVCISIGLQFGEFAVDWLLVQRVVPTRQREKNLLPILVIKQDDILNIIMIKEQRRV